MKKLFATIGAGITAAAFALAGCGGDEERTFKSYSYTYFVMDADATLQVYDSSDAEDSYEKWGELKDEIGTLLYALDFSLSATVSTSYVSQFNNASAGARVKIDNYTYDVLSTALSVYELTEGCYNPAVYYGVQAFGFNGAKTRPTKAEELPSKEVTDAYADLASHFGELKLEVDGEDIYAVKPDCTVTVNGESLSMKIDLGGIGKGYAVDLIDEIISEHGYEYGFINFGSSSIALKKFIDGKFILGCTDPRTLSGDPHDNNYMSLFVSDVKLSTSGDYRNYFELDGKRYCHIFDPFTARPVDTGMMTATIMGGSAAEDDALTTALIVMGADKAISFISEKLPGRKVVFNLEKEGEYYYYTNLTEGYELKQKLYQPYAAK